VIWRPDLNEYTAFLYKRITTSPATVANGTLNDTPLTDFQAGFFGNALDGWQRDINATNRPGNNIMCGTLARLASTDKLWARSLTGQQAGARVAIGPANNFMAGGCAGKPCPWDTTGANFRIDEVHHAIEFADLGRWMVDIRSILAKDMRMDGQANSVCMPPGFFWLRFGSPNNDTVGFMGGLKQPVHIQLSLFNSRGAYAAGFPMRHPSLVEAVEQLNLCK
jgi:hypothetical protein